MSLRTRYASLLYKFFLKIYRSEVKRLELEDESKSDITSMAISNHAVVRYMERMLGVTRQDIMKFLEEEHLPERVSKLGEGIYSVGDMSIVVKGRTVVTMYKNNKGLPGYSSLKENR